MSILLDIILLTAIVFLSAYVCLSFIPMALGIKLVTSGLITILFVTLIRKLFFKRNPNVISYRRFVTYLIWQGEDSAKELLKKTCKDSFEDNGEYVIADGKAIFLWTKYGSISADTAVKFYRTCKKNHISEAYILTTNGDKKMMGLIKSFGDVTLTYCTFKDVYRRLKKQGELPADVKEKIPASQLFKLIIHSAFTRKNGFRFVGISLLLLAISFFTPLRNYYIILASVNLALSIGCLVAGLIRR